MPAVVALQGESRFLGAALLGMTSVIYRLLSKGNSPAD